MAASDLERVFEALERSGVRYLVVGGVAVVLHGHLRFTADLDLVVRLDDANAARAIDALIALGFQARAPVDARGFADAAVRRSWIDEKGLTVFSLWSPALPGTEVDLFVAEPFDFDEIDSRAVVADLATTRARVICRADLIAMKRRAGRPRDLEDADVLESLPESSDG